MAKYGYVRVSVKHQEENFSLEAQKQQLIQNGIPEENIFVETGSVPNEIQNFIDQKLHEGDTFMITRIDRCSRNTFEFLNLQDTLLNRKIEFVSLDLPHSNDPHVNQLIATTLSIIAQFEKNRRKERQAQGIQVAKKKGKYKGRKTVITPTLIHQIKTYKEQKSFGVTKIAKLLGISSPTVYKVLKNHLGYISNRLVKQPINESYRGEKLHQDI